MQHSDEAAGKHLTLARETPAVVEDGARRVLITAATPVHIGKRRRMSVKGLAFCRETGEILFVLARLHGWSAMRQIPMSNARCEADAIHVPEDVRDQPDVDDAAIAGSIRRALSQDAVLRWFEAPRIDVLVEDGGVRVSGFVTDQEHRRAIRVIGQMPGSRGRSSRDRSLQPFRAFATYAI